MQSCLYQGFVRHRRFQPVVRQFSYWLAYLYLDLDELPQLLQRLPLLSDRRFAWASCYRPDHLGAREQPLDVAARDCVQQVTQQRPRGPIRLLTQWRCWGYYFSPLNLYFCYSDQDTSQIEAIVAEVNNTPWRQQHCYVLWSGNRTARQRLAFQHDKAFHVSPFLDLNLQYHWQIAAPAKRLVVHLATRCHDQRLFDATMSLQRYELNTHSWLAMTIRHPLVPFRVLAAIYYEAFQLWRRKCPYYAHPQSRPLPNEIPDVGRDSTINRD